MPKITKSYNMIEKNKIEKTILKLKLSKEYKKTLIIFIKSMFVCVIFVLIDQITKYFFTNTEYNLKSFPFAIRYAINNGSSFSMFANLKYYNQIIIIISFIFIIAILLNFSFFIKNQKENIYILLLAGIIGNLLDRIVFGHVRDFIHLKGFFIFNLADLYLFSGAIYIILLEFSEYKFLKTRKRKKKYGNQPTSNRG